MNGFLAAVGALIPSIGVGLVFWFAMRSVIRADGREREALAAMERERMAAEAAEREPGREPSTD